jgi:hypothetical protein
MSLVGDTAVARSTLMWPVDMQSLVHFAEALLRDNWTSTAGRRSDSWILVVEAQKPRSWLSGEDTSTVRLVEQRSWAVIAWF